VAVTPQGRKSVTNQDQGHGVQSFTEKGNREKKNLGIHSPSTTRRSPRVLKADVNRSFPRFPGLDKNIENMHSPIFFLIARFNNDFNEKIR
jgi:hypothetical protein